MISFILIIYLKLPIKETKTQRRNLLDKRAGGLNPVLMTIDQSWENIFILFLCEFSQLFPSFSVKYLETFGAKGGNMSIW